MDTASSPHHSPTSPSSPPRKTSASPRPTSAPSSLRPASPCRHTPRPRCCLVKLALRLASAIASSCSSPATSTPPRRSVRPATLRGGRHHNWLLLLLVHQHLRQGPTSSLVAIAIREPCPTPTSPPSALAEPCRGEPPPHHHPALPPPTQQVPSLEPAVVPDLTHFLSFVSSVCESTMQDRQQQGSRGLELHHLPTTPSTFIEPTASRRLAASPRLARPLLA